MLTENKFSKYLLYAVGEIVLVVIGILIALQINNWNNNKINIGESNEFNQRLLAEVNGNIDLANDKIEIMRGMISSSKGILDLFNKQPSNEDLKLMDSLIFVVISGVQVEFRTGTLNEGLNTGKVALIDSDVLKSKLYGLPSDIQYVRDIDKIYSNLVSIDIQPFLYKNFNYRRMDNALSSYEIGPTKFKFQHNKLLLENEQFENLIDNYFFSSNSQMAFHTNLKNEFENIKKMIEVELNSEN